MSPNFAEEKKPVIVVGAGLAGLTTAYRLHQKGIDVHLYEARNRVGGRVLSVLAGENCVELGGQNIADGGAAENMLRLIDECQLELIQSRHPLQFSYFDGEKLIPEYLLQEKDWDYKEKLRAIASRAPNIQAILKELCGENQRLLSALSVRLAAYEGGPPEKLSPLYVETLSHMLQGGICSAHPGVNEGNNYIDMIKVKGGNARLAEKMAQALEGRVHLNMPLISVAKDESYILTFQNGHTVKTTVLVLAIPCSVFDSIYFTEDVIPSEKLKAIEDVQYGTNAKILIPALKHPTQVNGIMNDCMGSWFDMNSHTVTLYFIDDSGKFTEETIAQAYEKGRPLLERGYSELKLSTKLPTYARDQSFLSYEGSVGYSWPNDPFAKGSYAYIASGQEAMMTATHIEKGEIVKDLFSPVDGLYFAGEHASTLTDVSGTMEAACESGERTARMIIKRLME